MCLTSDIFWLFNEEHRHEELTVSRPIFILLTAFLCGTFDNLFANISDDHFHLIAADIKLFRLGTAFEWYVNLVADSSLWIVFLQACLWRRLRL